MNKDIVDVDWKKEEDLGDEGFTDREDLLGS